MSTVHPPSTSKKRYAKAALTSAGASSINWSKQGGCWFCTFLKMQSRRQLWWPKVSEFSFHPTLPHWENGLMAVAIVFFLFILHCDLFWVSPRMGGQLKMSWVRTLVLDKRLFASQTLPLYAGLVISFHPSLDCYLIVPQLCRINYLPLSHNWCRERNRSHDEPTPSLEMIAYMLLEYNGPWKRSLFREPYISLYVCWVQIIA